MYATTHRLDRGLREPQRMDPPERDLDYEAEADREDARLEADYQADVAAGLVDNDAPAVHELDEGNAREAWLIALMEAPDPYCRPEPDWYAEDPIAYDAEPTTCPHCKGSRISAVWEDIITARGVLHTDANVARARAEAAIAAYPGLCPTCLRDHVQGIDQDVFYDRLPRPAWMDARPKDVSSPTAPASPGTAPEVRGSDGEATGEDVPPSVDPATTSTLGEGVPADEPRKAGLSAGIAELRRQIVADARIIVMSPERGARVHVVLEQLGGSSTDVFALAPTSRDAAAARQIVSQVQELVSRIVARRGDGRPRPHLTPQQRLAMSVQELGYDRPARLALAGEVLGREVGSFNELTAFDCARVWSAAVERTSSRSAA